MQTFSKNHIDWSYFRVSLASLIVLYLIFVVIDTALYDIPSGFHMVGAAIWRAPFELLIILSLSLTLGRFYSVKYLSCWFILAGVISISHAMDELWSLILWVVQVQHWLPSYMPNSHDSVIAFSIVAIIGLCLRLFINGYSFAVIAHLVLISSATVFLSLVTAVTNIGVGEYLEKRSLEAHGFKAVSPFFIKYCENPGIVCYEGPWKADADYKMEGVESSSTNIPEHALQIAGVDDINKFASESGSLIHVWSSGFVAKTPLHKSAKFVSYYKDGETVKVMVDYRSASLDQLQKTMVKRWILGGFSLLWIISGLCLFASIRRKDSPLHT